MTARHCLPLPLALFLFFLVCGVPASAQTVTGSVLSAETGQPLPASWVALVDSDGTVLASTVTDGSGRFRIASPGPGRYSLRVERLGRRAEVDGPFELEAGQVVNREVQLAEEAISLAGIQVEVDSPGACRLRPGEGEQTVHVWNAARAALQVEAAARREGTFRYRLRNHTRELTPNAARVVREDVRTRSGYLRSPYMSAPVEELLDEGWVREDPRDGGYVFFAPDAHALLSDRFQDAHCFRIERSERYPGMVGLGFEPREAGTAAGVRGTLWLDEDTGRLEFLTFTYTDFRPRIPPAEPIPDQALQGRVDYIELPGGYWIVNRWFIRIPLLGTELRQSMGVLREVVALRRILEEGGQVTEVRTAGGEVVSLGGTATVRGVVLDGPGGNPLPDAVVRLDGTSFTARTDSAGTFTIEGVASGIVTLRFEHTGLWPLIDGSELVPVEVPPRGAAEVEFAAATPDELVFRRCIEPFEGDEVREPALVAGVVSRGDAGPPTGGVSVHVERREIQEFRADAAGVVYAARSDAWEAVADASGRFSLCVEPRSNLPEELRLVVRDAEGSELLARWFEARAGELVTLEVRVGGGPEE